MFHRRRLLQVVATLPLASHTITVAQDWPSFRGPEGQGVAGGYPLPEQWKADPNSGEISRIRWRSDVPGLGHSSPILWGDQIFVSTAISSEGSAPLSVGPSGAPTAADDQGEQSWVVLCYRASTGEELWRRTARAGKPRELDMSKRLTPTRHWPRMGPIW